MSLVTISDIHIHEKGDAGWLALQAFSQKAEVTAATHVGLLGDIFDLMAGDHVEYVRRHESIFQLLRKWCEEGKVVFYAEGNHDMHLGGLFRRITKSWSAAAAARLVILKKDRLVEIDGRQIYLGHGDRYNQADTGYLKYMDFITHRRLDFFADRLMPYLLLKVLGEKASKKSRKYGHTKFDEENVRKIFRAGVSALAPQLAQVVVGGHSHVVDEYHWDGRTYLNNGYPPTSRRFVVVDGQGARLAPL